MIYRAQKLLDKGYKFSDALLQQVFIHQCCQQNRLSRDAYIYTQDTSTPSTLDNTLDSTLDIQSPTAVPGPLGSGPLIPGSLVSPTTLMGPLGPPVTGPLDNDDGWIVVSKTKPKPNTKWLYQTRHKLELVTLELPQIQGLIQATFTESSSPPPLGEQFIHGIASHLTRLYKVARYNSGGTKDKRVLVELEIPTDAHRYPALHPFWSDDGEKIDIIKPVIRVSQAIVRGFYTYGLEERLPDDLRVFSYYDRTFEYPMDTLVADDRAREDNVYGIYGLPWWELISVYY
jgi:hypothetical protein